MSVLTSSFVFKIHIDRTSQKWLLLKFHFRFVGVLWFIRQKPTVNFVGLGNFLFFRNLKLSIESNRDTQWSCKLPLPYEPQLKIPSYFIYGPCLFMIETSQVKKHKFHECLRSLSNNSKNHMVSILAHQMVDGNLR